MMYTSIYIYIYIDVCIYRAMWGCIGFFWGLHLNLGFETVSFGC